MFQCFCGLSRLPPPPFNHADPLILPQSGVRPMSSTSPLSESEFSIAARRAPPHPLHLEKGYKIIVGSQDHVGGEGGSACSLLQKSGCVNRVVRASQMCYIRFDGDEFDTALSVQQLLSRGYKCPDVEHRGDKFCNEPFLFTCQENHVAPTRRAFQYYLDLDKIGFDFENVTDAEIGERGDRSPISKLFNAPPPASSQGDISGESSGDLSLFPLINVCSCIFFS